MKNISKITLSLLVLAAFAFTSCKDSALEKVPTSRISTETVFSTTENAWAAINGIDRMLYSQWYSRQSEGGISGNFLYNEVLAEDFVLTARANGWFISEYAWLAHRNANSTTARFNYGFFYAIIGNANQIIMNIDDAVGPAAEKTNMKAQALAYRAWAYFNLVQLYGKRYVNGGDNSSLGMSLVLEASDEAIARSSVEETYAQINKDIDEAISLFGSASPRIDKSHINMATAKGIKARIALTQQNWSVAAQMAKEARAGYQPMSQADVMGGFSDYSNSEWMWGVHHRDDQPTYFYSFFAYVGDFSSTNTRGNPKAINSLLYDEISDTDIRKNLWDPTGTNTDFHLTANGVRYPYMNQKFRLANPGNSNGDLAIMRAAEMYLIEAEALAHMGNDSEAQKVLYELANARDNEYEMSTNTGADLLEEILIQRRVELWAEGFRFLDLKRLNLPLDRDGANHNVTLAQVLQIPAGDKRWEWLIPQGEIDRTQGVVVQNPL